MNHVDMMLLQMFAQIGTQTPEVGKGGAKQDSKFEDMLAQKSQEKAPQANPKKPEAKPERQPESSEASKEETAIPDEQRVLAAALAAQALTVAPAQDIAAPVVAAAPVVQAVAAEQEPQGEALPEGQVQNLVSQEAAPEAQNTALGKENVQASRSEAPVTQEKPVQAQEEAPVVEDHRATETRQTVRTEAEKPVARQTAEAEDGKTVEGDVTDRQSAAVEARPLFQKAEAPIKVGEPEVVDTTKGDMDAQLAGQVEKALAQGSERITLKLTPENLGTITLEMTRNAEGVLNVAIHTGSEKTLGLLSRHAESLGALLQSQTQAPVNVEVQHTQENQQSQYQQQGQQQQQEQQSGDSQGHQQQQQSRQRHEVQDFLQQLRLGLAPLGTEAS